MSVPSRPQRPPVRLRARILIFVSSFALLVLAGVVAGGLWVVLEAEDAILDANLGSAVAAAQAEDGSGVTPGWLALYDNAELLRGRLSLTDIPVETGMHEVFARADGNDAIWVRDWSSRWQMWRSDGLEHEFRLWVEPTVSGPRYWVADLETLEFTESRIDAIQQSILGIAVTVALAALVLGWMIARWTLHPVLRLAREVGSRTADQPGAPLAPSYSKDEIGFLAEALDEAEARAGEALARERRFISDCSHELRTPLATTKSGLTVLEDVDDDPVHRSKVVGRLRRSVDRMERLVQLFLVLAREGRELGERGSVPMSALIEEVTAEQAALHDPRKLTIESQVPAGTTVSAQREVLAVLMHNFVINAWRHSGGDLLRFRWVGVGTLQIDDNGRGFDAEHVEQSGADTRGYGIGLSLAARLCRTQGWRVTRGRSDLGGARVEVHFTGAAVAAPADDHPLSSAE